MERDIRNIQELRAEIKRLQSLSREQETYLVDQYGLLSEKIRAPFRFANRIIAQIPGLGMIHDLINKSSKGGSDDWVTKVFKIGSTTLLDRMFFKRAGLVSRVVLGLISQQAAGLVNKEAINEWINKLTSAIKPKRRRRPKAGVIHDYGIPPDSETY